MNEEEKKAQAGITKFNNNEQEEKAKKALSMMGDVLGESTIKTIMSINDRTKLENVAIFVDYDNVYWTLMNTHNHDPDQSDPDKNIFNRLWRRYGQDNVRTFRVYADFEKIKTNLSSLQKKRIQIRHVYSNDKDGDNRKNSSDIELCIDAIESTYKDPSIACYVFVTADSDMIPILSRMMYKGKRVELYYLSTAAPKHVDITNYVHSSEDLIDFLDIEVVEYNIEEYIIPSLKIIKEWEENHKEDNKYFLGLPYLRTEISKKLALPIQTSSELIEVLSVQKYIEMIPKKLNTGYTKQSCSLTDEAKNLLLGQEEAAADSEIE